MQTPKVINNISERVIDDLKVKLSNGSNVSIAAASFSIYAFEALKKELENIDELRFIFTSPTFIKDKVKKEKREFIIPKLKRERNLYGSDFEIRLRNKLEQKAIAKECAEWIRRKVKFKSNSSQGTMGGFLHIYNDAQHSYVPFNEFTTTELGCERGNNIYSMVNVMPSPFAEEYLKIFNEQWENADKFEDVTTKVLEYIETVYQENSPEFIYFLTLYNIFNEFLDDINEDVLPNEKTGFRESVIWNKLYNFQKDAALAIINKLEKYNGCILADSVGLGKTFTALSVIKYYENRNKSVLVLCPKKLFDNWSTFKTNYKNNPLVADRLRYDILFHSDLSRNRGMSSGIDLERINWGNYDLVVVDESHNFRNGGKIRTDENDENPRLNRYLQLMERVIKAGVKTKVLMLSATPVNNGFNDLKNQIQLAYEGKAEIINELLDTSSGIEEIFRKAQAAYNTWSRLEPVQRTTQRLLKSLTFDFFEVLDSVTIARSRRHIEQYYDTTAIGKFPTRLKPISRRPHLTDLSTAINYNEIFQLIGGLNLAIYTPSDFILPSKLYKYQKTEEEGDMFSGMGMAGRERGIRRLMSINLLKRLESSVNSFRLTLDRVLRLIEGTIAKIDSREGNVSVDDYDFGSGLDLDESSEEVFIGGKKSQILLDDMDYIQWRSYLADDVENLKLLIFMLADITPEHDSKLQQLKEDLREKFSHPINGDNKKIIIFTAFSDTADYLYDCLAKDINCKYGLDVALISGSVDAKTTKQIKGGTDFNKILTLFSPISKERDTIYPDIQGDIDILIATDCISEGQNLQDCDYLINYDIHWNPVRIIQRFGRIDRIGSKNEVIQLVNYWPDMDLDDYIDLKGRVEARMKAGVMVATGDENPLSTEEKGDLEYRRNQLKRLQTEVVDLEDMNTGISIMDLGLNEFRLDLLAYMHEGHDVVHTPFGLHAVVQSEKDTPPGIVFVLKNHSGSVNIDAKNRLHPFYMVYLSGDGEVIINHLEPKALLDRLRHICKGKSEPIKELCKQFNKETKDGLSMGKYSDLLGQAIASIINVKEESDIDSFLGGYTGDLFTNTPKGLDEFELICFFIVK